MLMICSPDWENDAPPRNSDAPEDDPVRVIGESTYPTLPPQPR